MYSNDFTVMKIMFTNFFLFLGNHLSYFTVSLKMVYSGGLCMAQLVRCLPLASVMIGVLGSSPTQGFLLSGEPASPSLSAAFCLFSLSLSFSVPNQSINQSINQPILKKWFVLNTRVCSLAFLLFAHLFLLGGFIFLFVSKPEEAFVYCRNFTLYL